MYISLVEVDLSWWPRERKRVVFKSFKTLKGYLRRVKGMSNIPNLHVWQSQVENKHLIPFLISLFQLNIKWHQQSLSASTTLLPHTS